MPRSSRSFTRLFICLPLIAVLGIWVFSYGRYDNREFVVGHTRYLVASTDGQVQIWRSQIADPGATARAGNFQHVNVPYWAIWLGTAVATLLIQRKIRPRKTIPGR